MHLIELNYFNLLWHYYYKHWIIFWVHSVHNMIWIFMKIWWFDIGPFIVTYSIEAKSFMGNKKYFYLIYLLPDNGFLKGSIKYEYLHWRGRVTCDKVNMYRILINAFEMLSHFTYFIHHTVFLNIRVEIIYVIQLL